MTEEMVEVTIDLPKDVILELSVQAHELDITLNQHIVNILMQRVKEEENKYAQMVDACGREWLDISSEKYRVYRFPDQEIVEVHEPLRLLISDSGGHRVFDNSGQCHYIPAGWIHIRWVPKEGQPHFVA